MNRRTAIFLNSVSFVLGFTLVFSIVGVLLQTLLSAVAYDAVNLFRIVGGLIIIIFGILLMLAIKYRIPLLSSEHKIKVRRFRYSYLTSFVFGVAFAIGWTPCVSFILGSIYALAATSPGLGFLLLFTYALGIGVPFLLAGAFASRVSVFIERSQNVLKYFNIIGGLLLILIGAMVLFNYVGIISSFLVSPESMDVSGQLSIFAAFIAGVITFISPCILPLLPAFFSYMAGTTAIEAKKIKNA